MNPNLPFILTTDASNVGLGAHLDQMHDGQQRTTAFASKTLFSAERRYSTPEREALACVWAVEHFEKYLLGRHFTLRTDQCSLTALLQRLGEFRCSKRISRSYDRLRHFNFSVETINGKFNSVADMLSHLGADSQPSEDASLSDGDDSLFICGFDDQDVTLDSFRPASEDDPIFARVRRHMEGSWPPLKTLSGQLRPYYPVRRALSTKDSFLFL